MCRFLSTAASFAALLGCGLDGTPTARREVSIAAASDLRFALDEITRDFQAQHQDIRVSVAFGSSGNFHSQLLNQAPFDVFLSADLRYPRALSEKGLTLPGSEFTYAVGRIVLWVPATSPIDLGGIGALNHPSVTHIAIANPQHAPYGRAAEAAMRLLGVYDAAKPKLVYGEHVAQALQFVQSGNAEIGIVALSLAVSPTVRGQGRFWEFPLETYPRLEQGGAIMKWAKDADAARAFRDFLLKPKGRTILKQYGFFPPGA